MKKQAKIPTSAKPKPRPKPKVQTEAEKMEDVVADATQAAHDIRTAIDDASSTWFFKKSELEELVARAERAASNLDSSVTYLESFSQSIGGAVRRLEGLVERLESR